MKVKTINEVLAHLRKMGKFPGRVNIQMDIIASHLQAIATRAIQLKDKEITDRLKDLGVIGD